MAGVLHSLDMWYLETAKKYMRYTDDDKHNVWIGKRHENLRIGKIWNAGRGGSRQASRTDRGVGHYISAVCVECTCSKAYMPARLCFGQLSVTGKVNRVQAPAHADVREAGGVSRCFFAITRYRRRFIFSLACESQWGKILPVQPSQCVSDIYERKTL